MAIYYLKISMIGGASPRTALAAAAYRSAEKLKSTKTDLTFDFTRKKGVVWQEILLPPNAPAEYQERETLWNSVEQIEKNVNAQQAREVLVALPTELSREQQIACVQEYIQENFVSKGMIADYAIHDRERGKPNPHAHILLTTRAMDENGQWMQKEKKVYALDENGDKIPIIDPETGEQKIGARGRKMWKRETVQVNPWNDKDNAEIWRASWAQHCNRYLAPEHQLDHRSYERQGIDKIATMHIGKVSPELAEERRAYNAKAREYNHLTDELAELQKEQNEVGQVIILQAENEVSRYEERAENLTRMGLNPVEIQQSRTMLERIKNELKQLKTALTQPQRHRGEARELFGKIAEVFRQARLWFGRKEKDMQENVRQYEAQYEQLKDTMYRMNLNPTEQAQIKPQTMELRELFGQLRNIDVANNPPEQNFFLSIAAALKLLEKGLNNIKEDRRNELALTFGDDSPKIQKGMNKDEPSRDEPDINAILAAARSSLDDSRVDRGKSEASTKSAGADRAHREAERERHRAETRRAAERAEREAEKEFGQERDEDYGERE